MAPGLNNTDRSRSVSYYRSNRFGWSGDNIESFQALQRSPSALLFGPPRSEDDASNQSNATEDQADYDRALTEPSSASSQRSLEAMSIDKSTDDEVTGQVDNGVDAEFERNVKLPPVFFEQLKVKSSCLANIDGETGVSEERKTNLHQNHEQGAIGASSDSLENHCRLREEAQGPQGRRHKQIQSFIPRYKGYRHHNTAQQGSPSPPGPADLRSPSPQISMSSPAWHPSLPVTRRQMSPLSTPSHRRACASSAIGETRLTYQSHLSEIPLEDSSSSDDILSYASSDDAEWDLVENPMNDSTYSDRVVIQPQREPAVPSPQPPSRSHRHAVARRPTSLDALKTTSFEDAIKVYEYESPEREYDEMRISEQTQTNRDDWTVPDNTDRLQLQQESYSFETRYPNAEPILRGILSQMHLFEAVGFVRPTINPAWDRFASALDKAVWVGDVAGEGVIIAVEGAKIVGKAANDVVTLAPDLWVWAIGQWIE